MRHGSAVSRPSMPARARCFPRASRALHPRASRFTHANERTVKRPESGKRPPTLAPRAVFYSRILRAMGIALAVIAFTLTIGVLGYRSAEELPWIDAFHQAALLLSGMGPVDAMHTSAGKVFDSCYALFCGVVLLATTGFLLAPVIHRLMHSFHAEDTDAG